MEYSSQSRCNTYLTAHAYMYCWVGNGVHGGRHDAPSSCLGELWDTGHTLDTEGAHSSPNEAVLWLVPRGSEPLGRTEVCGFLQLSYNGRLLLIISGTVADLGSPRRSLWRVLGSSIHAPTTKFSYQKLRGATCCR